MYIYDTREENYKNLPLNGWLFPCLTCGEITSSHNNDVFKKNFLSSKLIYVPICKKCKRNKVEYELDPFYIKKIN